MKSSEKAKRHIMDAPRYRVSAELDAKVLRALGETAMPANEPGEIETLPVVLPEIPLSTPSFGWVSLWLKRSLSQYVTVVAVFALMWGGFWAYTQSSYSYHLEKAKAALADLESMLEGKPRAVAWIDQAWAAEENQKVDEGQATELSARVLQETELAIDIAEHKDDPGAVRRALEDIGETQDRAVPVLAAAAEAVDSDEATQQISMALQTTTTDRELVEKAVRFVAEAEGRGERQVAIDIQTSRDHLKNGMGKTNSGKQSIQKNDPETKAEIQAELKEAQDLIMDLRAEGVDPETLESFRHKAEKAATAFEKGKMGRAKGLSTAILAEGKHISRATKAKEKDRKKESREENAGHQASEKKEERKPTKGSFSEMPSKIEERRESDQVAVPSGGNEKVKEGENDRKESDKDSQDEKGGLKKEGPGESGAPQRPRVPKAEQGSEKKPSENQEDRQKGNSQKD